MTKPVKGEEHMNENKISIKQYEQAADEKVSLGGIKWEKKWDVCVQCDSREEADRIRTALAQPEPTKSSTEPVAWGVPNTRPTEKAHFMMLLHSTDGVQYPELLVPLYTAPPQREWQGLTDEEIESIYAASKDVNYEYERSIEAKLKEKNNG